MDILYPLFVCKKWLIIFSKGDIYYIIIVVNDMSKLNNKGFTLIELLATVILLSIVVGIAGYSITAVIEKSKEKDYQLLVKEIKNSVELYYQECRYVNNNCDSSISLGFLVKGKYGY